MGACTPTARMRPSKRQIMAVKRPGDKGIQVHGGAKSSASTRRKPVKSGLVVDERAHSPDIALGKHTRPFASLAACILIDSSHWQVGLPLTTTVRPLMASWRLPTWQNDGPRPVPRPQLCCAPEFNSPVGLLRWTSCTSDKNAQERPRTMAYPAAVTVPPMLDGRRL